MFSTKHGSIIVYYSLFSPSVIENNHNHNLRTGHKSCLFLTLNCHKHSNEIVLEKIETSKELCLQLTKVKTE